jgi:urease accessory protein
MAFIFLANPTAGILAGDEQTIEVDLGPGCQAHICTQAATKVFSMPDPAESGARQTVNLTLQEGAYLEYLPDPMIPFRNARFSQETLITMAPGAILILSDTLSPGRVEMGESFAFDQWCSRLTVATPSGEPLYREAFSLAPRKVSPLGVGVMGRFTAPVLGTLLLLNDSPDLEKLGEGINARVRQLLAEGLTAMAGVSVLPNGIGVGLKVIGEPASAVAKVMRAAWAEARRQSLGAELPRLRKY